MKRVVSLILLLLLLVSMCSVSLNIRWANSSSDAVYIRADGSIDPPTASIFTEDNVTYTLTGNITNSNGNAVVIERSSITLDCAGYTVVGYGSLDGVEPMGSGVVLNGVNNVTISNATVYGYYAGIFLEASSYCNVLGNTAFGTNYAVLLDSSPYDTVGGNNMSWGNGICVNSSFCDNLTYNNLSFENVGIDLSDSNCTYAFGNTFTNSSLYVSNSFQNSIENNTVNGKPLVYLENKSNTTVNNAGQVVLVDCENMTVENSTISWIGNAPIELWATNNTQISENMLINNYNYNIVLLCSSGDIISENNITGNPWGDYGGLFLYLCSDSVVCENNITDNEVGLWITDCSSISVCGNAMENNWGSGLNLEGDGDAPGYNIISGNNITGGILGILFRGSNSDNITGNNIITDVLGVWLSGTVSDCVFGNNISAFATGDYLEEPMEKAALFLDSSVFNTIYENNITNSLKGMSLSYSSNNTVFHNRFVNNSLQVMSNFSTNTWDNGYPSGGNYWSDYNGTDYYNGAYQNLTGCDGIGDTPYMIDSNNTDHYPLAHQSGLVGDLNRDNNVGLDDLVLMAEAYGSHAANYDYQGETASHNWNPNADIAAPYGKISLSDLVTLALHYGQHYP